MVLNLILSLFFSSPLQARPCDEGFYNEKLIREHLDELESSGKGAKDDLAYARKNLSVSFLNEEYLRLGHEPLVQFETIEQARFYAQNHPAFDLYEFGKIDGSGTSGWTKFEVSMEKSSLYGKKAGWEKRYDDGTFARYRLDWDPEIGGHINLEFIYLNENLKLKKVKLGVGFKCNGQPCSDADVIKLVDKIFQK
jgi:hypothetical protein